MVTDAQIHRAWKAWFFKNGFWQNFIPNEPLTISAFDKAPYKRNKRNLLRIRKHLLDLEKIPGHRKPFAKALSAAIVDNAHDIKELESESGFIDFHNTRVTRKFRTPTEIAEAILVGIELHKGSAAGLDMLRSFFSPRGEFSSEFEKRFGDHEVRRKLCIARGLKTEPKAWANSAQLEYRRVVLSDGARVGLKSFKGHETELEKLKLRIKGLALTIRRKLK